MNLGLEINSNIMTTGSVQLFLEDGYTSSWLNSSGTGSDVVFSGVDRQVFQFILEHFKRHHKVPDMSLFREHFPEESYRIRASTVTAPELSELAVSKINSYLLSQLIGTVIDLHDESKVDEALTYLRSESERLGNGVKRRAAKADDLNDSSFDVESLLSRKLEVGIPFGVKLIDDQTFGFQPGQLVTVLGRQKSGKTTFTLNSALEAWKGGWTVLFFSVEMDVDILRQRLYCLGSHVSPSRMRRGHLKDSDKERVRDFHKIMTVAEDEDEGRFFISKKKSLITVSDIHEAVNYYNPNVVYIDGFNFMLDRRTNKMADDWQANENLAAELKTLALENQIVVVANAQVQEKQYHAKFGIEARTISGGTGLLKASDLVIGSDKTNGIHTVSCVLSRDEVFDTVVIDIDWDTMVFNISEADLEGKGI